MQWAQEFATTIDELGWFGLLFVFELETYLLSDDTYRMRRVRWSLLMLRLFCYVLLFHTLFARVNGWSDFIAVSQAPGLFDLCQLAGKDISFSSNYLAELITENNCHSFSDSTRYYFFYKFFFWWWENHRMYIFISRTINVNSVGHAFCFFDS